MIYFLGVSSNSLVFKLIHPTLNEEKSLNVIKEYGNFLNLICCLISRKAVVIRKSSFNIQINLLTYSSDSKKQKNKDESLFEMNNYFKFICTCCDKKKIDTRFLPRIKRRKNYDLFQTLYNRPKYVDTQILMQFIKVLCSNNSNNNSRNQNETKIDIQLNEIKSTLLKNLVRTFNHLEFGRQLNKQILVSSDSLNDYVLSTGSGGGGGGQTKSNPTNTNLTYIYKEAFNLLSDSSLKVMTRFDFSRFSIPKLISINVNGAGNGGSGCALAVTNNKQQENYNKSTTTLLQMNEEAFNNAMSVSIFSLNSDSDPQLDHNFNLENQLCEGFLRAKSSKNLQDLFMYIISLGRYALSLKKCDEYMFICVKHLLEIFNADNSNNKWALFSSALAQRQLFILSKRINMTELLSEFEEKVCETVADTVFNTIQRHQILYSQLNNTSSSSSTTTSSSYLQKANNSLKDVLRVFNVNDSNAFIKNYQRYIVPYLMYKSTLEENQTIITKSLDFLARKSEMNTLKLIEDNFPYIFTYATLMNSKEIANVFYYISNEIQLDIDKLINYNKQRLFNELLAKCGNIKYKSNVWQAVCVLTAPNSDEATALVTMNIEDSRVVKAIEPGLLAALIHFDMCLMKSSINLKEKCQVLESLNVLIQLLGPQIITKVRYKIMTTLKLAMQQCSKFSELNCKLWDTFLRNVDKSALGAILNQVSVNLLQMLDLQPYKISKIFEYLIVQNKDQLESYFNELYFIPEQTCLQHVNSALKKYTDIKYLLDQPSNTLTTNSAASLKSLVNLIRHYLKGSLHENADLRCKALEKLYSLLKEKCSQIIYLIQRQENSQIISEIVLALLNG